MIDNVVYIEAQQHLRVNAIDKCFNLWGRNGSVWINYATAKNESELERSKTLHGPCEEWEIIKGYR